MTSPDDSHPYHCVNHDCGGIWSADQLLRESFGEMEVLLCPKCRLGVEQLVPQLGFWARVPSAFRYPFQGNGPWMLVGGTVLFSVLNYGRSFGFLIAWLLATVLLVGIFGMLLIHVVQSTAADDTTQLDWPDIGGLDDLIGTTAQILGSLLVVFVPFLYCAIRLVAEMSVGDGTGTELLTWLALTFVLGLVGLVYYPMSFLVIAMFGTVTAITPTIVLPAVIRTRWHYLLVLVLLLSLYIGHFALGMFSGSLPWWAEAVMFLPTQAVVLYLLIVSARLLGLLYLSNRGRLGWFEV